MFDCYFHTAVSCFPVIKESMVNSDFGLSQLLKRFTNFTTLDNVGDITLYAKYHRNRPGESFPTKWWNMHHLAYFYPRQNNAVLLHDCSLARLQARLMPSCCVCLSVRPGVSRHVCDTYKKLSCRREAARCLVSVNISLSRWRSLKIVLFETLVRFSIGVA